MLWPLFATTVMFPGMCYGGVWLGHHHKCTIIHFPEQNRRHEKRPQPATKESLPSPQSCIFPRFPLSSVAGSYRKNSVTNRSKIIELDWTLSKPPGDWSLNSLEGINFKVYCPTNCGQRLREQIAPSRNLSPLSFGQSTRKTTWVMHVFGVGFFVFPPIPKRM